MTGHQPPVGSYVPTTQLPAAVYRIAIEKAADVALQAGCTAVAIGVWKTQLLICTNGCCAGVKGGIIAVPDVQVAEFAANDYPELPRTIRVQRLSDSRSVSLFRTGERE